MNADTTPPPCTGRHVRQIELCSRHCNIVIEREPPATAFSTNRSLVAPLGRVVEYKALRGYKHCADKFGIARLTPVASETVAPPRVLECPIQLEAELVRVSRMMTDEYDYTQHERSAECTLEGIVALEVRIKRVYVSPGLLMKGRPNRIDPDLWKPIIMSFCRYYGLGPELAMSKLARIPERAISYSRY